MNSQVLCQGKGYCMILFCSQSDDLPLGHCLRFCCVFCNMFCLIFSGSFHLSHRKSRSGSAVIQRAVICGFVVFLLRRMAFLTVLSLSENEMKTKSNALHLDFGASPRFLSPLVEMSFLSPGPRFSWGLAGRLQ